MEFLNSINALTLIFASLLIFAIVYRFDSRFIAHRVLWLNGANATLIVSIVDESDYVPTSRDVLFGHRFAAIPQQAPYGACCGTVWLPLKERGSS